MSDMILPQKREIDSKTFKALLDLFYLSAVLSQYVQELAEDAHLSGISPDCLPNAFNSIKRLELVHESLSEFFNHGKE